MAVFLKRRGRYQLFETARGNRILRLGLTDWYAWVSGQQGEMLVRSDDDHVRNRTLHDGEYYLVDFEDDPTFTDMPHLFLQRDGEFRELIVPNGLPTDDDVQKRIVPTDKTIPASELRLHLGMDEGGNDPAEWSATSGQDRPDRELPIENFDELSVRAARVRLEGLSPDELRSLRAHEAANKQRKTLLRAIDRRLA